MTETEISRTVKIVAGETDAPPAPPAPPIQDVVPNASMPPVRSIMRVVLVTLLILFLAAALVVILVSLKYLFFLIVLSIFFAYLIEPLVKMIRRPFEVANRDRYMPRPLAIATAYLLVFLTLGVTVAALTPQVTEQAKQLTLNLPAYSSSIQRQFRDISNRYERYRVPEAVQTQINERVTTVAGTIGTGVTEFFIALASYLPWLILIPVLAFFFLKDANLFRVSLLRIVPSGDWRARAESVLHDVNTTLAAYTRAQLISCIFIGAICSVAFYLLGVNYALLLGVLAGILEFVPLIGPLTIAIIAVTIASLESTREGIYVFAFLAVLRILQDYIFYPRIVREGIHLHPLAIILSVLAGEQVAGIPGVFLSIPVVALLTVVYKHVVEYSGGKGIFTNILVPKENSEALKSEN